jgi:hypothetical protein
MINEADVYDRLEPPRCTNEAQAAGLLGSEAALFDELALAI